MLYDSRVPMEAKAFAVGLRVEHPQKLINISQYGAAEQHLFRPHTGYLSVFHPQFCHLRPKPYLTAMGKNRAAHMRLLPFSLIRRKRTEQPAGSGRNRSGRSVLRFLRIRHFPCM